MKIVNPYGTCSRSKTKTIEHCSWNNNQKEIWNYTTICVSIQINAWTSEYLADFKKYSYFSKTQKSQDFQENFISSLTPFIPLASYYTPWEYQKNDNDLASLQYFMWIKNNILFLWLLPHFFLIIVRGVFRTLSNTEDGEF